MPARPILSSFQAEERAFLPGILRLPILPVFLLFSFLIVPTVPSRAIVPAEAQSSGTEGKQASAQAGKAQTGSAAAEAQLQDGIRLTSQGHFADAIPHLLAARGHVAAAEEFAAGFDLALCYVGTGQFKKAVPILEALRQAKPRAVNVENLLAQAYVGTRDSKNALAALRRAAALDPHDEKLYVLIADACLENDSKDLGLRVSDLGLTALPHSARLHYERGVFLSQLERSDLAIKEFHLAAQYGTNTAIAYMGTAQAALLNGNMPAAVAATRAGLKKTPDNYILLAILGKALIRSGAVPGQQQFTEALQATEKAVAQQPRHAGTQVTLGELYLMEGQIKKAIVHLEKARTLDPRDTSVYAHLADAYRRSGDPAKAREVLATLARLNQRKAATYRTGSSNERKSYLGGGAAQSPPEIPHLR